MFSRTPIRVGKQCFCGFRQAFSTAAARQAAPKQKTSVPVRKTRSTVRPRTGGKAPGQGAGEAGGSGGGRTLSDSGLAGEPVDLSSLPAFIPEVVGVESAGMPMAFPESTVKAFATFGLPRQVQKEFAFANRPTAVVRDVSLRMVDLLESSNSSGSRWAVSGPSGSGKTFLTLQAVSHALSQGWIVLYIPNAIDFVNSTQPYFLATPKSASKIDDLSALPESPRYHQASLASSLLQRLHSVNGSRLSKLPAPDAGSKNFGDFVAKAARLETGESTGAWGAALNHLAEQNQTPVLIAIDQAQALFRASTYRDPVGRPLESFELEVPLELLRLMSGQKALSRGTILLTPSTLHSSHISPSFEVAVGNRKRHPYEDLGHPLYLELLRGLERFEVPDRLSRIEAAGIMNAWGEMKLLRTDLNDRLFLEHYVDADGNPRSFTKSLSSMLA